MLLQPHWIHQFQRLLRREIHQQWKQPSVATWSNLMADLQPIRIGPRNNGPFSQQWTIIGAAADQAGPILMSTQQLIIKYYMSFVQIIDHIISYSRWMGVTRVRHAMTTYHSTYIILILKFYDRSSSMCWDVLRCAIGYGLWVFLLYILPRYVCK